ncbi:hypothetical protein [Leisingera sp.]|uniref:hypothetical protein n=1 Tax=Leisingera sp. TaxID=1879318 RepID=UPI002B264EF7|nr:hypothetical protein [Leisingera sp.]
MKSMRILIGCETSSITRRAVSDRGHDVWSCDIEAAEDGSNGHKTLEMVKKYRNQANQKRLSQSAQARRTRT